ncbi:methionine ABC transporter substrate-binding protein [Paenibacillus polymyxa]|nr:MetQ/NlpA family ABC transporter substrate-binding protein [Paenibacillus polymyxa]OBA01426.1 methionine ABC transporter substrate-binding protein [Paenibacillus polymyxa]
MKKWVLAVLSLTLIAVLAACGTKSTTSDTNNAAENTGGSPREVELKVGASPVPHAEILEAIKPQLEKEGVRLQVVQFNDYVQPNVQLFDKQLDANFYQHVPYLNVMNKERKMNLVSVGAVHLEPFGIYSQKYKKLDELPDGATVAIPNDATNGGRALLLLEKQGLIKLKDSSNIEATVKDITENKKNLKFKELEAAMLPRQLPEVDIALINTNYALEAKLNPTKDALALEDKESPYANVLVARPDNKDSEAIKKLLKALQSPETKKFIEDKYQGAIIPAF